MRTVAGLVRVLVDDQTEALPVPLLVTDPELCPGLNQPCESAALTDDTYVRGGQYESQSFGAAEDLLVKTATPSFSRETLLRFDLTGADLQSGDAAALRMYAEASPTATLRLQRVDPSWTEGSVTWATKPATTGDPVGSELITERPGWHDVDVTALVQAARAEGAGAVSISVTTSTPTDSNITFASKERGDGSLRPQLLVAGKATG